jgi:predicted phosphate transport protein (TIGR00153 family)
MLTPFGKTKRLESQVDQFLDLITRGTFCMREAIGSYLGGDDEDFQARLEMVGDYERKADELRKSTETMLYAYSLLPESRGDILGLLEDLDNVIDRAKQIVQEFDVQQPDIEIGLLDLYVELTNKSVKAVDQVVEATRAFFLNEARLRDCINKVGFYESEADRAGLRLKRQIFQSDMELARKHHLRYFADALESLSDIAEVVSERLTIANIKRSL